MPSIMKPPPPQEHVKNTNKSISSLLGGKMTVDKKHLHKYKVLYIYAQLK